MTRALLIGAGAAVAGVALCLFKRGDVDTTARLGLPPASVGELVPLETQSSSPAELRNAELRNARRTWRRPVDDQGRWLSWVRPLQGQTGVYLIRGRQSREVLYVGECHRPSQGLLKTLRRHMWQWTGPTAGPTYRPTDVEVSYELTEAEAATRRQFDLIQQFTPRDNVQDGRSLLPLAEVPF